MDIRTLSESSSISPGTWMAIAVGLLTMIYAVFLRPMKQRKNDPLARAPGFSRSLSRQRSVELQMENLLVELSAMARQITAQLDTRAARLDALIREADAKIAAMQSGKIQTPPGFHSALAAAESPIESPMEDDPRHRPVYELADSGMPPAEISRRIGRPSGEIELILALRPRRV